MRQKYQNGGNSPSFIVLIGTAMENKLYQTWRGSDGQVDRKHTKGGGQMVPKNRRGRGGTGITPDGLQYPTRTELVEKKEKWLFKAMARESSRGE